VQETEMMTEKELEGRKRLVELCQQLMLWKAKALEIYSGLSATAQSRIDCMFVDSIDPAIYGLMATAAWPPVGAVEEELDVAAAGGGEKGIEN
jgi:hypothetical protein